MLALAMILTAAMVVPANVPATESGEMEQGLDLRGEWEGVCKGWPRSEGMTLHVWMESSGHLALYQGDKGIALFFRWIDEGQGRLKGLNIRGETVALGIYKQETERLVICVREREHGRATSFRVTDDQCLLILHRVKPRK